MTEKQLKELKEALKFVRKQQILWLVIGIVVGIAIWEFVVPYFAPESFYDWLYGIETYYPTDIPDDLIIDYVG